MYDEASFLAGLAVGRSLWKPPTVPLANTGLGWRADGRWLHSAADEIARITKTETPWFSPGATISGPPDHLWQNTGDVGLYNVWVGYSYLIFTTDLSARYAYEGQPGSWNTTGVDGVWYGGGYPYQAANVSGWPDAPSIEAAANRILQHVTFTKTYAGKAIACIVKWRSGDWPFTLYCSPVLISSNLSNTTYSRNGVQESNWTFHYLGEEAFFMCKGTDDPITGSLDLDIITELPVYDLSDTALPDDGLFDAVMLAAKGRVT